MVMLSPFFVLFSCNPGPQSQIMPRAASIYDKLRSLARRSSPQWRRKVRVCRLASGLASGHEFTRKRRYSWLQPHQTAGSDSATGPTPRSNAKLLPDKEEQATIRRAQHLRKVWAESQGSLPKVGPGGPRAARQEMGRKPFGPAGDFAPRGFLATVKTLARGPVGREILGATAQQSRNALAVPSVRGTNRLEVPRGVYRDASFPPTRTPTGSGSEKAPVKAGV